MGSGPDDYACEIILEDLDRLVLGAWGKCLEIRVECCLGRPSVDWVIDPSIQVLLPFVFG